MIAPFLYSEEHIEDPENGGIKMAGKQDYRPGYDEDEHSGDERLEEGGVPYTRDEAYGARSYETALGIQENDELDPVDINDEAQQRRARVGHDPNYLLNQYGPDKNFPKRPKEEILDDVEQLIRTGHYATSYIQVRVNEVGEVTLEGEINSLDSRRFLEESIWNVYGVRDIRNRLVIAWK